MPFNIANFLTGGISSFRPLFFGLSGWVNTAHISCFDLINFSSDTSAYSGVPIIIFSSMFSFVPGSHMSVKQDSFKMNRLVADDPRKETFGIKLQRLAETVLGFDPELHRPFYHGLHAGYAQARLLVRLLAFRYVISGFNSSIKSFF